MNDNGERERLVAELRNESGAGWTTSVGELFKKSADLLEADAAELAAIRIVVHQLGSALTQNQWGFNHRRCCLCAGFNAKGNGETDHRHTNDCPVAVALKSYAALPSPLKEAKDNG